MTFFKIEKTQDYILMPNQHLRNANLSLTAIGLFSLMLSLPDNTDYTVEGLSSICKEGEDCIRMGLAELEQAGYVYDEHDSHESR